MHQNDTQLNQLYNICDSKVRRHQMRESYREYLGELIETTQLELLRAKEELDAAIGEAKELSVQEGESRPESASVSKLKDKIKIRDERIKKFAKEYNYFREQAVTFDRKAREKYLEKANNRRNDLFDLRLERQELLGELYQQTLADAVGELTAVGEQQAEQLRIRCEFLLNRYNAFASRLACLKRSEAEVLQDMVVSQNEIDAAKAAWAERLKVVQSSTLH